MPADASASPEAPNATPSVDSDRYTGGSVTFANVTSVTLAARTAALLLNP